MKNYFYLCHKDTKFMMKKGFFDALFAPGSVMDSKSLLGAERIRFFAYIEDKYGFRSSALYNRMFKCGFDQWMLEGIDQVKDAFALEYPELGEWRESDKSYWDLIVSLNIPKMTFYKFLQVRGFKSIETIARRFHDEDWKTWERIGMEKILTDYCDRY